jgi:hypothetical protein
MHRLDFALSQVNALFWFRLGCEIPSISTVCAQAWRRCAQVIHMFVHRQQGSSSLTGWQAAADRHARRSLQAWPARRVPVSGTRCPIRRPWRVGQASAPARFMSSAGAGAGSRVCLRPRRRRHNQGVSPPEHHPLQMAAEFYAFIGCCGILVSAGTEPRYLCDAGQQPIADFLKPNLARLVRQAGKRCYRRRPRRR